MATLEEMWLLDEPGRADGRTVLFRPVQYVVTGGPIVVIPPDVLRVRTLGADEVAGLMARRARSSVFARLRGTPDSYTRRLTELGGQTVIDVRLKGLPEDAGEKLRRRADIAEDAMAVAVWCTLGRARFENALQAQPGSAQFEVLIARNWKLRTKSKPRPASRPLELTASTRRVAARLGVWLVAEVAAGDAPIGERLRVALHWLAEAAHDRSRAAAAVKLSTALESLLGNGHDSATRSVSERSAYLLSDDPQRRRDIARAAKAMYTVRSEAVHGLKQGDLALPGPWIDAACKLVLAVAAVIATNRQAWPKHHQMVEWTDQCRWGPAQSVVRRVVPWTTLGPAVARLGRKL